MSVAGWRAVVLAAGRGPDDPIARAFGVVHKCALSIAGRPMLARVVDALVEAGIGQPITISIDDSHVVKQIFPDQRADVVSLGSKRSAPESAIAAAEQIASYPLLITTGDHALLTPEMIHHFCEEAAKSGADTLAGLATRETIASAYPSTKRTYFNLGGTQVSGCNLFAIMNERGLAMLEAWKDLERNRKKPWKLVAAFGLKPLFNFMAGMLTPEKAFNMISDKLGIRVRPVFMPFAEAAIDVDKPSDHQLAEAILRKRELS